MANFTTFIFDAPKTGGADAEVYVMDCNRPSEPTVFVPAPPPSTSKHTADVTRVAWNTKVAHIVASAGNNGTTIIWDLRQKKAWTEIRDPTGAATSDIAWNPDQGLYFVTASADGKITQYFNENITLSDNFY